MVTRRRTMFSVISGGGFLIGVVLFNFKYQHCRDKNKLLIDVAKPNSAPNATTSKVISSLAASTPLINVYDLSAPVIYKFEEATYCVNTTTEPSFSMCVFDPDKDRYISKSIIDTGKWEPENTAVYQKALRLYPDALVLDIGANIGFYSLLSSKMGHDVIAVEPISASMERLHKSANLSKLTHKILAIQNVVSDEHTLFGFVGTEGNKGRTMMVPLSIKEAEEILTRDANGVLDSITMDDLLLVINAQVKDVIIKIDIEGFECRAMASSSKFFERLFAPYIFMEWVFMAVNKRRKTALCRSNQMKHMVDYLISLQYVPYELTTGRKLTSSQLDQVTMAFFDVLWVHVDAKRGVFDELTIESS